MARTANNHRSEERRVEIAQRLADEIRSQVDAGQSRLDWKPLRRIAGVGPRQIDRLLSERHLTTAQRYMIEVRTEHAERLLAEGEDVLTAAIRAGFSGPGRLHDAHTARRAVDCVREAGFENYSIDLLYGLPGQALRHWEETLEEALELSTPHLSAYELTLEPGTPLAERLDFTLGEDRLNEMHLRAEEKLEAAGYEHYEISNYARPGFRCRHNIHDLTGGECLGLGAGAHSYLNGVRSRNIRLPEDYRASVLERGHAVEETERLPPLQAAAEAVMIGLRLKEGIDLTAVGERTGSRPLEDFADTLGKLVDGGHVIREESRIRLSDSGRLLADAVAEKFLGPGP